MKGRKRHRRCRKVLTVLFALLLFACQKESGCAESPAARTEDQPAATSQTDREPPGKAKPKADDAPWWTKNAPHPETRLSPGGPKVVTARGGVVTSVEDQASRAGARMLTAGGNAVDAAVATAFALAVTHPSAGNIGGGGFLLLKVGDALEAIDFREDSPAALSDEKFWKMIARGGVGPASVGVPGTVSGLHLAHSRHGKLDWKTVVEPAVELAKQGYVIGERQHKTIGWSQAVLRYDPVAREALLPGGKTPAVGSQLERPKLAVALARIRDLGPAGFYQGATARDIVDSLGDEGLLTLDDLAGYEARLRPPLWLDYRGHRVLSMPPPSGGGVALIQNLAMLAQLDVHEAALDSAERVHLIAEVNRRSQTERRLLIVAPEAIPAAERAARRARWLSANTWLKQHPVDTARATRSKTLHPLYRESVKELEHTTHLSAVDGDGNVVSCTVTLSGSFGSRVLTKQTGIVLNNSVASFASVGENTPAAARRTISSMAPTLVWSPPDTWLALGSPGGDTIPATVTQVLLRLVNRGQSLHEAVAAPRIHQGFVPDQLWMERQRPLDPKAVAQLRRMGHRVVGGRSTIGDANVAAFFEGRAWAVADAREGGLAAPAAAEDDSEGDSDQLRDQAVDQHTDDGPNHETD